MASHSIVPSWMQQDALPERPRQAPRAAPPPKSPPTPVSERERNFPSLQPAPPPAASPATPSAWAKAAKGQTATTPPTVQRTAVLTTSSNKKLVDAPLTTISRRTPARRTADASPPQAPPQHAAARHVTAPKESPRSTGPKAPVQPVYAARPRQRTNRKEFLRALSTGQAEPAARPASDDPPSADASPSQKSPQQKQPTAEGARAAGDTPTSAAAASPPVSSGIAIPARNRLFVAEDRGLSKSLEAEEQFLRQMGWGSVDTQDEAPLTEDEIRMFEQAKSSELCTKRPAAAPVPQISSPWQLSLHPNKTGDDFSDDDDDDDDDDEFEEGLPLVGL